MTKKPVVLIIRDGWGINPGDRQSYTALPATGRDTMLQYVPVQPRSFFLTYTQKF